MKKNSVLAVLIFSLIPQAATFSQEKLYFITGNQHKFSEMKAIIPNIEQINIDLTEIQETDAKEVVKAKILEAFTKQKGPFIIEDTSLYMQALGKHALYTQELGTSEHLENQLPGPLIKWFMSTIGNEGLFKIARCFNNYRATARTIIAYGTDPNNIQFFDGQVAGFIVNPAEGAPQKGGRSFGWDPLFRPVNATKTFAQMSPQEKAQFSMRGIAARKLKDYLDLHTPLNARPLSSKSR